MSRNLYGVQGRINASFEKFKIDNKNVLQYPSEVDYQSLTKEIERLIYLTKNNWKFENYHSIFIYGPTGNAKSEIVKQIAEEHDCIYHKLEIQKVPIEEFEGFPYLEDRDGRKVVRLAHPTVLPDSDSDKVWLLHLDEFNKADTEKMAAVMNLVLTGEVGGAADYNKETGKSEKYKLPKKTIIIGSGNFKVQENVENLNVVNQMDTATSERFHRMLHLDYNAQSWLETYASKPFSFNFNGEKYNLQSRIMPIVLCFVLDKFLEDGKKSPFLITISVRPEEGGSERTMSPRSWTLVSDNMLFDAVKNWNSMKGKGKYKSFDDYIDDPNIQIELLIAQTPEFGIEGSKIVQEIVSRYIYFSENRILPDDIINAYSTFRDKIRSLKEKKGIVLYLLLGVGYLLDTLDEVKDMNKCCINLSTFIQDTEIPVEDLVAFIQILDNSKNKICKKIHEILYDISEKYKNSYSGYYYTSVLEVKGNGKHKDRK